MDSKMDETIIQPEIIEPEVGNPEYDVFTLMS